MGSFVLGSTNKSNTNIRNFACKHLTLDSESVSMTTSPGWLEEINQLRHHLRERVVALFIREESQLQT
ncbi:hypothetical protein MTR_2g071840 [Medicago truncatula]|uniref:Uncharacterized protein n=1 Tax=Medicago truncatula TaxID=3880 RepID=A0A072VAM0_MEDTR|nr:hypothetical protein MTR_2g071840 [Medicago truncatula]